MMQRLTTAIVLLALYLALTGNLALENILVGALVAAFITALLPLQARPLAMRRLLVGLGAALLYIGILAIDVIRNGLDTARIILDPRLPIKPGIVAVPSHCQSELAAAINAHAMTVAPGELVVGIDAEAVMYTHTLDISREEDYAVDANSRRQELLRRIFP